MNCLIQKLTNQANRFFMAVLTTAVTFSLVLVAGSSWHLWVIANDFKPAVTTVVQLQQLSATIIHLDEVLTMSARMAAATGDLKWESRYRQYEPELDAAIKRAIALVPESYETHAMQTDAANLKLVKMEREAFELVRQGQTNAAMEILLGPTYESQKQIYADGIHQTTESLENNLQSRLITYNQTFSNSSLFSLISFPVLTGSWLIVLALVNNYIHQRRRAELKLNHAKQALQQSNQRLQKSEQALRQKAEALEKTLYQLQQAQVKMVHSEKMSSLGLLVAGIAHEINNPINFIHGNLEFLEAKSRDLLTVIDLYQQCCPRPTETLQQYIEAIDLEFLRSDLFQLLKSMYVGTDRIQQIVQSLRSFSRRDEAECKWVDIHEGIDSTLMILQHRLKGDADMPDIEVIKHYGDIPRIECYVGPLNQVFMNLLSNAIDAIQEAYQRTVPQGARNNSPTDRHRWTDCYRIHIETKRIEADWVEIAIADNGIGMTKAICEKVFEPFFTTKPIGKGTGLGMSISYQIVVERHQGTLECLSQPTQGTRLIVRIPTQQSNANSSSNPYASQSSQLALPQPERP